MATATETLSARTVDMKLEVVVVPVSERRSREGVLWAPRMEAETPTSPATTTA